MKTALVVLAALLAALLGTACDGRLDCAPRTVTPTGDLSKDLLGAWDSWGIDSRVVATFHADGGVTLVEEPNQYAPTGNSSTTTWALLDDGGLRLNETTWSPSIASNALTLSEDGGVSRVHPALTCRGKGLEP